MESQMLSADDAAALIGLSKRTFFRLREQPGFPAPHNMAPAASKTPLLRWYAPEVLAWARRQPRVENVQPREAVQ